MIRPLRTSGVARLLVAAPVLVVALAACGGGSSTGTGGGGSPATAAEATGGGAAPSGSAGARQPAGVSGQTAQIDGDTLQVRTAEGQTAVQFTTSTRITEQKTATVAAVTVGSCVVVIGAPDAAGTGVTAQTVTVSPATAGQDCAADAGGGRGFGGGGAGFGGARGTRTGQPGGPGGGFNGNGNGGGGGGGGGNGTGAPTTPIATAFGTVTAVTPTTVTLQGRLRSFTANRGAGGSPGASPTGSPALAPVSVTLAAATRYTSTVVVPSSALAVGQCVTAIGPSNDIGAVAARSIAVRPAGSDGTCTAGFGGFGGRRGGASGSAGAPSGTTNG